MEDIAIIGMSCRFPGEASSIEGLWQVIEAGQCAYSDFPKDRFNIDGFYHPDGHRQGSLPFKGAHFVKNNLAAFDAAFFSMTEEDVRALDPQQRMLLETSFEAIESAGLLMEDLKGSDTSVYVGAFVRDYEQISLRDMDFQPRYASTGSGTAIMSNRLSYFYDLHGASMTVDTGCSGSMVAMHLACQNIKAGNSRMAIAAGAGLILTPNTMMPMTALNFLSKDGRCFTFDDRANGYGRGEGVGLVILKKLSDALEDNDPIRAVIRASHMSQDGRTAGITLPSIDAQVFNIRQAYEKSGLDFDKTGYVECHGTGTQAGDLAELTAISQTLSKGRTSDRPLLVGSVKPNVGHLEGAAGVAGLIKGALVVEKGVIPPVANFQRGNSAVRFDDWNIKVPTQAQSWPDPGIRRASVNCFGFGGTNAHAILDAGEPYRKRFRKQRRTKSGPSLLDQVQLDQPPQLFLFSGPNLPSTERLISSYLDYLPRMGPMSPETRDSLAYTLACRRTTFATKAFVVANSRLELYDSLGQLTGADFARSAPKPNLRISFLFSGQGTQRPRMGQGLLKFPVFKESLQKASDFLQETLESPYDLFEQMMLDKDVSHISDPGISQPATTALQIALVDLLKSFGIQPSSVVGHSSGEIAAAYACGHISRETAWTVAYHRGVRASQLKDSNLRNGSMMFASISEESARRYLESLRSKVDVEIACINSPSSVTLSGDAKDIARVMSYFKRHEIFCREVPTGIAYHSQHMLHIENAYMEDLQHLPPASRSTSCYMYSSLKARQIAASEITSKYWCDNLISPVRFSDAVHALVGETKPDMVIELSPHASLKTSFEDTVSDISYEADVPYAAAMLRNEDEHHTILRMLGSLWARGYPANMEQVVSRNAGVNELDVLTSLPLYPWDHTQKFWHESALTKDYRLRKHGRQDLIGAPGLDTATQEPRWRGFLRLAENPWLKDHQVQKTIVYPAAGLITMVIEGVRQQILGGPEVAGFEITDMRIERPMVIPDSDYGLETVLHMKQTSPDGCQTHTSFDWTIYSRVLNSGWTRHAHGFVRAARHAGDAGRADDLASIASILASGPNISVNPDHFYENLDLIGMNYGPTFRNVVSLNKGHEAAIGTIAVADTKSTMPHAYEFDHIIHPATLDSSLHLLFALDDRTMVPSSIESVFISASKPKEQKLKAVSHAVKEGLRGARAAIAVTEGLWEDAAVVIKGLRLTSLAPTDYLPSHRNLCTEMQWKPDYTTVGGLSHYEELVALMAHKYPALNVLQIGAHAGYALHTISLLQSPDGQAPRLARYTFYDSRYDTIPPLVEYEYKSTPVASRLETRDITLGSDVTPKYHLIINTQPKSQVGGLDKLLHPDGVLLIRDMDAEATAYETDSACSCDDEGYRMIIASPYSSSETPESFSLRPVASQFRIELHNLHVIILLPPSPSREVLKLFENLRTELDTINMPVRTCELHEFLSEDTSHERSLIISFLDLSRDHDVANWSSDDFSNFKNLLVATKGILWVTTGASGETKHPRRALGIGLARSLASEDPETAMITLDLCGTSRISRPVAAKAIFAALKRSMLLLPAREPRETEYREIEGVLHISRLVPFKALNEIIEDDMRNGNKVTKSFRGGPDDEVNELMVCAPGEQDTDYDNIFFTSRRYTTPLGPDEVEMIFSVASIQHNDLHTVKGLSSQKNVGVDVQGTITRVGSDVQHVQAGMKAVAIVSDGAFRSRIRVDKRFVQPFAGGLLTYIPSIWIPVYYALKMRCHVGPGRRVLIHRAATSTGQAAIQIAQRLGAEVFVTVCEDDKTDGAQKRALAETFGLGPDIEDCGLSGWDAGFLRKTGGQKMDVVIEPGAIPCPGSVVKKTGTVVQILDGVDVGGSRDTHHQNHSTIRISFLDMLREDSEVVVELFKDVNELVRSLSHDIKLLFQPRIYEVSALKHAFQAVHERPNLGTVFGYADDDTEIELPSRLGLRKLEACDLSSRTIVLAGGLGGLGRSIAQLLIDNGAKSLVFLSRSKRVTPNADEFLRENGALVRHIAVDICDEKALSRVAAQELRDLPPVGGVIQAAAVLKDTLFSNMSFSDWQAAVLPKYKGTTNLVKAFDNPLEKPWFLFLSSSSGIIGNRGQANYAAGNVFMDVLAGSGLINGRAISLDIGPVLEVGMVADDADTLRRLRETGFYGIRRQDFLKVIERSIAGDVGRPGNLMPSQVILGVGTGGLIRQSQPKDPYWSRTPTYSYLNCVDMPPPDLQTVETAAISSVKGILASSVDVEEATLAVGEALKRELASKLATITAEDVDLSKSLQSYGVDSLLAVQIRVWALNEVGASISIFNILCENPMRDLCRSMVKQVREKAENRSTTPLESPPKRDVLRGSVQGAK